MWRAGPERGVCMAGERGRILLVDQDASCRRVLSSGLRRGAQLRVWCRRLRREARSAPRARCPRRSCDSSTGPRSRRQPAKVREAVEIGDLRIDFLARVVELDGARIDMPRKEFDLLARLATVPGLLCSRDELLEDVFGFGDASDSRTLDVHVYRLRSKLEKDPAHPGRIVTVRGLGFLLTDGEPVREAPGRST